MVDQTPTSIDATGFTRGQLVLNPDESLTSPKNIIQTLSGARAIYLKYREKHIKRIALYARIEGLLAGNPPYDPAELQKNNLLHIANFNTLDARAMYERGALAYWNLLNQTQTLVKFKLIYPGEKGQDPALTRFSYIMAKNWDYVVRQWKSFNTLMNTLSAQIVKFGVSPVIWPDERDWRWRVVELSRFFVQDQAQSDIEELTAVCVETIFTAQYLFEVYSEYKDKPKDASPWDVDELAKLLFYIANNNQKTQEFISFMDLQRKLQNGDISYDNVFTDEIRLVSLFYKEYDGEISHYMFHRNYEHETFLYFADRQYKNLQEALVIFTASPGEFTIHSNRGLGHKIFSMMQAMNQLDCSMVDMARLSSTPFLKGVSVGSRDFEAIKVMPGVPTSIGTAEFVQTNFGANINQLVGLSQYITQKVNYNAANAGDDPSVPDSDKGSISASEFRARSFKEFGVLKNNIAHFYNLFDCVVANMVVKMLNSKSGYPGYEFCKEWKTRCLDEGVPEEVFDTKNMGLSGLPRHLEVKASRVAGDGSTLARLMGLQELQVIAADFGPREAQEYKREWIQATMGPDYVATFLQSADDVDEQAGGASLAGVENAVMQEGKSAIFSRDNEHRSHLVTHLALATEIIQQLQQQESDPIQADKIFNVLIPHIEEHYNALINSPFAESFIAKVKEPVNQVSEYARFNRKNAGKMLQAQIKREEEQAQKQQEVLSDQELKNVQAANEERRKDIKVGSQVQRAKEASDTRADIQKEKVVRDSENQRLKIRLDAKNKMKETDVENPRQTLRDINGATPSPYDIESNI